MNFHFISSNPGSLTGEGDSKYKKITGGNMEVINAIIITAEKIVGDITPNDSPNCAATRATSPRGSMPKPTSIESVLSKPVNLAG